MSNTFADTIRQLRINKGLSQLQLADEMYVTHSTISRWEAGSRLPDAMMISRLAKCLETSTEFLFSLISEEKETPNIIMVDDEAIILSGGLPVLEEAFPDANITGFIKPSEALSYAQQNPVALAFLDIEMGQHNGAAQRAGSMQGTAEDPSADQCDLPDGLSGLFAGRMENRRVRVYHQTDHRS